MATATVKKITGTPRTFSAPDRPYQHLENAMAKKQYHNKARLIGELAKKKITRSIEQVLSDVRKAFGVAVYTPFGYYTSQPTGYECSIDMARRLRRARSALKYGLGVVQYAKKYSKVMKAGMTKDQWTAHRRLILAFDDLEAAALRIFAKYKV